MLRPIDPKELFRLYLVPTSMKRTHDDNRAGNEPRHKGG